MATSASGLFSAAPVSCGPARRRRKHRQIDWRVSVQSEEGKGATFTIYLPIENQTSLIDSIEPAGRQENLAPLDESAALLTIKAQEAAGDELPVLLIAEDNLDTIAYLRMCLEDDYVLLVATDGQQGIDMALEHTPDIIISDVMMPVRDGFELCRILKTDERTNHIPIILLTAKSEEEARLSGLEHGADAYLNKPFDKKELFLQLKNLLRLRQELQKRYSEQGTAASDADKRFIQEDRFVEKIRNAILGHIGDEDYGITEICRDVTMSRTSLHRKLRAITGRSTSHFIRAVRLQEGQKMLQTTDMTISDSLFPWIQRPLLFFAHIPGRIRAKPQNCPRLRTLLPGSAYPAHPSLSKLR